GVVAPFRKRAQTGRVVSAAAAVLGERRGGLLEVARFLVRLRLDQIRAPFVDIVGEELYCAGGRRERGGPVTRVRLLVRLPLRALPGFEVRDDLAELRVDVRAKLLVELLGRDVERLLDGRGRLEALPEQRQHRVEAL